MACCVAIALLIGLARRARYRYLPGAAPVQSTAPVARRPGPGQSLPRPAPSPKPVTRGVRPFAPGPLLAFAAGGVAIYTGALALLLATGSAPTQGGHWLIRDVAFFTLAFVALVGAFRSGTAGV